MNYKITFKFLISIVSLYYTSCAIDGSFSPHQRNNRTHRGENPCHPLYWYPRNVPEYCAYTTTIRPKPIIRPIIPMPIPVPLPLPPQPFYPPMYPQPMYPPPMMPVMPPAAPPPGAPPQAVPFPVMAPPIPLPFGIPLAPTNPMIPVAGVQYNPFQPPLPIPPPPPPPMPAMPSIHMPPANQISMQPQGQLGMVPGLPGIVSYDGGINIMPFSDAYADLLERHKQKMIRRRLQKFLDEYDRYPWKDRNKG